ncbi:hypothetical protein ACU8OR_25675 (plasmid) [Rhizobium leguminosarum]
MPAVQQKNLKDTVTMPTCPRNSHKGISARKRSEKNPQAATGLIPFGILLISNVQDNIPILRLLDSSSRREQIENIRILIDMMSAANTTLKGAVNDDCCP